MKTKNIIRNQKGMVPIWELLLLVALVGILGFVGYRAYQARQAKPVETTTQSPSESGYIVIKEFGVRMKLTPKIYDLEYLVDTEDGNRVVFGTKSLNKLAAKDDNNACATEDDGIGWIIRQDKPRTPEVGPVFADDKKIGGNYFVLYKAEVGCGSGADNMDALNKLQQEQFGELITTFETLEAN